jgi:hypothetical protein
LDADSIEGGRLSVLSICVNGAFWKSEPRFSIKPFRGFADNILVALWLAFSCVWTCGILSWIAWRFFAVRIWVRQHFPSEELETPAWEGRMTITFSALLLLIVASALLMAAGGLHPPQLPGN